MNDATIYAQGHCLCGGVQITVLAPLRKILVCHCSQCIRSHGEAAYYTRAAKSDIRLTGEEFLKWFQSSDKVARGFCNNCGSNLFYAPQDEDYLSIAAGLFYPGTDLSVAAHIYCDYGTNYQVGDPRVPCFGESMDGVMDGHH